MAEITIARLRKVRHIQNEIDDLEQMKLQWYRPVRSPALTGMPHSSTPSDPTASAVARIQQIDDKIALLQCELANEVDEILDWLYAEPPNEKASELRRIIICHYIDGMSWETTTRHVLGYYGTESAKQRVYRYFSEHKSVTECHGSDEYNSIGEKGE